MALEQAGPERVVSSDSEELILVDAADREIGTLSKGACHDGEGILHRAFSVFLFDAQGRLLVQQRAGEKRLWPGYWANSCCSHPRAGEDMDEATVRRTREELGVTAELEFVYKFQYQANYGDLGAENELCWVYIGRTAESDVRPNPTEIDGWRFLAPEEVDALIADEAADVAPWFRMEWRELRKAYWDRVAELLQSGK
ncbi:MULTISPECIES: isopentenyl-diphosphate Delta-isomerase [unclassified Wenzhouxiangella]|uniref:isopentenyl-diphosphate Delta-isomerase n=1 Tax=unclassified Wenzhouxiangella TaxID=2613841 RepID=UPI001C6EEBA5|nr:MULTISPECIES: isopentenyl-diphosphate Delta-isomerase [unclassified Wenzhouxiangella]